MSEESMPVNEEANFESEKSDIQEDYVLTLQAQLKKTQEDYAQTKDLLLRQAADFENYKKRQQRELEDFRKYAIEKTIKELIPVIDNFDRALVAAAAPDTSLKTILDGVKMVADQFRLVLENQGIKGVSSLGQLFDPAKHEAISERETDEVKPGTVVEEYQKAYFLQDRLVRPAMVVVAKAKTVISGS